MFERVFLAVVVIALCACPGPKPSDPTHPRGGSAQPDAGAAVTEPNHKQECDALVVRAIGLYVAELGDKHPSAQLPTEEEIAKLKGELLADPACTGFSREAFRCARDAETLAEFAACAPLPQP